MVSSKGQPTAWAIGHVTQDRIVVPGRPDREQFGGSAYYVALAWAALGWRAGIVTRMAAADAERLEIALSALGVTLVNHACEATTVFENRYAGASLAERTQRVTAVADPFERAHVADLDAEVIHLGPLTNGELPTDVLRAVVEGPASVSLDAQGDLRRVVDRRVVPAVVDDLGARLAGVSALKVDDAEATALVKLADPIEASAALEALGVQEVLVTFADRGALVRWSGGIDPVNPIVPSRHIDATGCGDTFIAAYQFERATGATPRDSARFAASAASLKLEDYGPLTRSLTHVRENLR